MWLVNLVLGLGCLFNIATETLFETSFIAAAAAIYLQGSIQYVFMKATDS